jgi:Pentapeptide repeats (8 copies)
MANLEHLAKLREGVETWNAWREENPDVEIDLSRANLYAANMYNVNLTSANLLGANLYEANLISADLSGANLYEADLSEAKLSRAKLYETNLSKAKLFGTNLIRAKMGKADLKEATLIGADLSKAVLRNADLRGTDLTSCCLQHATLDQANLTNIRLWETQRANWSIKEIICEGAYWDQEGRRLNHYGPGEFERLYSDLTRIELLYPGGMTTFELNTLPALLQHLTTQYPNAGIRLKSMEETGGGAKISLTIDDTAPETIDNIRAEATRSQSAQLALRDDEITRLKIQKQLLLEEVFPRMLAAAPQVHFAAEATNVAIAIGNSTVTAPQTHNDAKALLALVNQIKSHTAELPHPQQTQLEAATHSIEHELAQPEPRRSVIASGLQVIKEIAIKVVASGAEKTIEEHWHPWLSQLTALMQHWTS